VAGRVCYPSLAAAVEATGPVDIVDVFRRPEACPAHAREAVAAGARCLWLQLGIVSPEAAAIAAAGGLSVVMNRCTSIEHARVAG
jgi:predicted CoA-binding protein